MAWAVSQVLLKWTQNLNPLICMIFCFGLFCFLGQGNRQPFLAVTSGSFREERHNSFPSLQDPFPCSCHALTHCYVLWKDLSFSKCAMLFWTSVTLHSSSACNALSPPILLAIVQVPSYCHPICDIVPTHFPMSSSLPSSSFLCTLHSSSRALSSLFAVTWLHACILWTVSSLRGGTIGLEHLAQTMAWGRYSVNVD